MVEDCKGRGQGPPHLTDYVIISARLTHCQQVHRVPAIVPRDPSSRRLRHVGERAHCGVGPLAVHGLCLEGNAVTLRGLSHSVVKVPARTWRKRERMTWRSWTSFVSHAVPMDLPSRPQLFSIQVRNMASLPQAAARHGGQRSAAAKTRLSPPEQQRTVCAR